MPDEEFRPGAHDLETPFIFVPHGSPDPVERKRRNPGWVSFPATFVPHPRPIPKWKTINGQRWPLDKRGRPWPKTRYGRPTCPFDELPPGMPAPGTQYELLRKFDHPTLFWEGEPMPTVEELMAIGTKARAERAEAAPPPPVQRPNAYDGDGLGPVRDYLDAMRTVDRQLREFAEIARRNEAARQAQMAAVRDIQPLALVLGVAAPQNEREQTPSAPSPFPDIVSLHIIDTGPLSPLQFEEGANAASPILATQAVATSDPIADASSDPVVPNVEAVGSSKNTSAENYAAGIQVKERDPEDRPTSEHAVSQTHDADGSSAERSSRSENGQAGPAFNADRATPSTSTFADLLIQCTMDYYGPVSLTARAGALTALTPIPKSALEMPTTPRASSFTNPFSLLGHYFPSLNPRLTIRILGTTRTLDIVGRSIPFVASTIAAYDTISILRCTYQYTDEAGPPR